MARMSSMLACDTLQIQIRLAQQGYQFTLFQQGVPLLGGSSRPAQLIDPAEVRAIRKAYIDQVRMFHELELAGIPTAPPEPYELLALGRRVALLLPALARQAIVETVRRARGRAQRLRILFEVAPAAQVLLGVPWELLVLPLTRGPQADSGGEAFLLLNADVHIVRQMGGVGRNTEPQLTTPLTTQVVVAAPADGQPIATRKTQDALVSVLATDPAHFWYEGHATLLTLVGRIRATHPQLIHVLCHGEETATTYGTRHDLLFTHQDGFTQRVSAFDLAPALTLAPELQIVILQACHSGSSPSITPEAATSEAERRVVESIALALVRQHIPAVVAMQGEIGQEAAAIFVKTLYGELAQGATLDQALTLGRIAMQAAGTGADWSLPVVYQGSGQAPLTTWYTRIADRLEAALHDPTMRRTVYGSVVAWGLSLITVGVVRWLLLPSKTIFNPEGLRLPLAAWTMVGLLGPALIATAQRGVRDRTDLDMQVRVAARRAQWIGAYLGYAAWGLVGLSGLISLWICGIVEWLPPSMVVVLFCGLLLGLLLASYTMSRAETRSALAIAPVNATIYTRQTMGLLCGVSLGLIALPWGLLWVANSPLSGLLIPELVACGLGVALITMALGLRG